VPPIPSALSDHTLNESELKNLTSVLIDDPLRSVQALPGVTTGDDFTADFSARGAGIRSIGFNMDGVLVVSPVHAVGDINDGGSLSIFNGDVIESVTLVSGLQTAHWPAHPDWVGQAKVHLESHARRHGFFRPARVTWIT
jgi:hypothetical protein